MHSSVLVMILRLCGLAELSHKLEECTSQADILRFLGEIAENRVSAEIRMPLIINFK